MASAFRAGRPWMMLKSMATEAGCLPSAWATSINASACSEVFIQKRPDLATAAAIVWISVTGIRSVAISHLHAVIDLPGVRGFALALGSASDLTVDCSSWLPVLVTFSRDAVRRNHRTRNRRLGGSPRRL